MTKTHHETQTQSIRRQLEEQITSGALQPGQKLDEERLASMFGSSRTPIREAMTQLIATGLLHKEPRRGAVVASLDIDRLLQLFAFAAELAASCAKFASRRMSDATLQHLHQMQFSMELLPRDNSSEELARTNGLFHMEIINSCGNAYLIESNLNVAARLAPYFRYELTLPARIPAHMESHREFLQACTKRNADRCAEIIRRHAILDTEIITDFLTRQRASESKTRSNDSDRIDPVLGRRLKTAGVDSSEDILDSLSYEI